MNDYISKTIGVLNSTPTGHLKWIQAADEIRRGVHRGEIEAVRAEADGAQQTELKKRLPGYLFSGKFEKRHNSGIREYSGFCVIDFDGIDQGRAEHLKLGLIKDSYCFCVFKSPRGGIKALYRCGCINSQERHETFFNEVRKHLALKFDMTPTKGGKYIFRDGGGELDNAGKDIARLCFTSYDPDLWINPYAELWPEKFIVNDTPPPPPEKEYIEEPQKREWGGIENLFCYHDIISGAPKGERSEKIFSVINSLIMAGLNDEQITDVFEKYAIGEKYREKGAGRREWLSRQIKKARRTPNNQKISDVFGADSTGADAAANERPGEFDYTREAGNGDDGLATLYKLKFKDQFRYDHAGGKFYQWEGNYWGECKKGEALDSVGSLTAAIKGIIQKKNSEIVSISTSVGREFNQCIIDAETRQRKKEAERAADNKIKMLKSVCALLSKLKGRLQTVSGKKACLELASAGKDSIGMTGDEWDSNPGLLGFRNGIMDLKTMQLRPGARGDYVRAIIPHRLGVRGARSDLWEKFLNDIFSGDQELIDFVQRLFGYALSGTCKHHILPILWGAGRNGKGTLVEAIKHAIGGDLTQKIIAESLLSQAGGNRGGHDADTVSLQGKRICWGSETAATRRLNAAKVKELCGGDTLCARAPYGKNNVTFQPTHTIFLLTNYKPIIASDDVALHERLILIPFERQFLKDAPGTDINLLEKFKGDAETQAIIEWILNGLELWREKGLFPLPAKVSAAVTEYINENDAVGEFIEEICLTDKMGECGATALYNGFKRWMESRGERPLTQTAFGKIMVGKGFEKIKTRNGIVYAGLVYSDNPIIPDYPN